MWRAFFKLLVALLLGAGTAVLLAWAIAWSRSSFGLDTVGSFQAVSRPDHASANFLWFEAPGQSLVVARWSPDHAIPGGVEGRELSWILKIYAPVEFPGYPLRAMVRAEAGSLRDAAVPGWSGAASWAADHLSRPEARPTSSRFRLFEGCGWPFIAMRAEYSLDTALTGWDPASFAERIPLPERTASKDALLPVKGFMPLRPVPMGLIADTLFFATGAIAMVVIFKALQGGVRRLRRRCPRCGHDLRSSPTRGCPECGWRRAERGGAGSAAAGARSIGLLVMACAIAIVSRSASAQVEEWFRAGYRYEFSSNDGDGYELVDLDGHVRGFAPIHVAAARGDAATIRAELAKGVPVDLKISSRAGISGWQGNTPLICAALFGRAEALATLLEAGADANAASDDGVTALHAAAGAIPTLGGDHLACVLALIKAGANLAASDRTKHTPLMYASSAWSIAEFVPNEALPPKYRRVNPFENLRPHVGGSICVASRDGEQDAAARRGDAARVKALLDAGASVTAATEEGETALEYALATSDSERVRLLLGAGSRLDGIDSCGCGSRELAVAARSGTAQSFKMVLDALGGVEKLRRAGTLQCAAFQAIASEYEGDLKLRLLIADGWDPRADPKAARELLRGAGATYGGRMRGVIPLLEAGVEPFVLLESGNSLLVPAAMWGDADVMAMLLRAGLSPHERQGADRHASVLHLAAESARDGPAKVRMLLAAGAPVDGLDEDGLTPLLSAAIAGRMSSMVELIHAGAAVDVVDPGPKPDVTGSVHRSGSAGMTALLYACNRGADYCFMSEERAHEVVKELLAKGTNLDTAGLGGQDALSLAICSRQPEVVVTLLDAGASPNGLGADPTARAPGEEARRKSLVQLAVEYEDEATLELLLNRGAKPDVAGRDYVAPTALLQAATMSRPRMLALLLAAGADPNQANAEGRTALMLLVEPSYWARHSTDADRTVLTAMLLDAGAAIDGTDNQGRTALMHACSSYEETTELIGELLRRGASVKARNKDGMTPLHFAAMSSTATRIDLLLAAGGELQARDSLGRTALDIARKQWANAQAKIASLDRLESLVAEAERTESKGRQPVAAP